MSFQKVYVNSVNVIILNCSMSTIFWSGGSTKLPYSPRPALFTSTSTTIPRRSRRAFNSAAALGIDRSIPSTTTLTGCFRRSCSANLSIGSVRRAASTRFAFCSARNVFALLGREFGAMDSAREYKFVFNEAISFIVPCDTQEEIDYYWGKLSADPKAEQCGWLKDKHGLSWQIVPTAMNEMMKDKDEKRRARVTEAFLKMKKVDIAKLKEAYQQPSKSAA